MGPGIRCVVFGAASGIFGKTTRGYRAANTGKNKL